MPFTICDLRFTIDYFSVAIVLSFDYAQDGVWVSNNSANWCKSVSNRQRFEKTKPMLK
jgi:hypothetical protein